MADDASTGASDGGGRWWPDRETMLDLLVNVIPMGILLFFFLLFLFVSPWQIEPGIFFFTHFLTLFPLALLIVLTYVSARAISRDETRGDEAH